MKHKVIGGIDFGGTKTICAIANSPMEILDETILETTSPDETIGKVLEFFMSHNNTQFSLTQIGIGAFGPLDTNPLSITQGMILSTPKQGWSRFNLLTALKQSLDIPIYINTDVAVAALAEFHWGAAKGLSDFIYLGIGTGIGGGAFVGGKRLRGMAHPEMGHIYIPHNWDEDPYKGCCPFHGDCLEGLASGKAISDRWGVVGEKLPETHTAWDLETRYLGRAITNISLILSPVKVVLGGGVMKRKNLLRRIQHHTFEYLNGYLGHFKNLQSIEDHIVVTELGERTTIIGALTLAQEAGML